MRKQHRKMKTKYIKTLCIIASILGGVLGVIVLNDMAALLIALVFAPAIITNKHIYW